MSAKVEVRGVCKTFITKGKKFVALQETDLSIEEGRFVSLIGPSGCGKSTLFNIIAGLTPPTGGQVLVDGADIAGKAGHVGYMLQKDMLFPWRNIVDNIILGLEVSGVPHRDSVARALPLMERYGLKGFERHYPNELSGGMRQRAALLRTLLYDRDTILLDEPFGALDAQTKLSMQKWLLTIWRDFKKTIMFVTHDIDEAIYLSDDIYVFSPRPGRLTTKISVNIPRPREPKVVTTPEFIVLKNQLMEMLHVGAPAETEEEAVE